MMYIMKIQAEIRIYCLMRDKLPQKTISTFHGGIDMKNNC